MPKLVCFESPDYNGDARQFQNNDPDLTLNNLDFTLDSAIVVTGSWDLFDQVNYSGTQITLTAAGGPDGDGAYPDHADWQGNGPFDVKSIRWS